MIVSYMQLGRTQKGLGTTQPTQLLGYNSTAFALVLKEIPVNLAQMGTCFYINL